MTSKFLTSRFVPEGLTYDDVLLVPGYSEILPREVTIASHFTRKIRLSTPIVSAAMDTVTEHSLAIAIAQEGGIGVLHKNMSIEDQAEQVRMVKRSESTVSLMGTQQRGLKARADLVPTRAWLVVPYQRLHSPLIALAA